MLYDEISSVRCELTQRIENFHRHFVICVVTSINQQKLINLFRLDGASRPLPIGKPNIHTAVIFSQIFFLEFESGGFSHQNFTQFLLSSSALYVQPITSHLTNSKT